MIVDDSHGVGVMGATGRGVAEHFGLLGEIDVITGTLGKALGGAAGGFVAASAEVCEMLAQRSRPQLFSNALPPTVACSALEAVRVLRREPELRRDAARATRASSATRLRELGFNPLDGKAAIVPIIVGETAEAIRFSERLLEEGVFVTGLRLPGRARRARHASASRSRRHSRKSTSSARSRRSSASAASSASSKGGIAMLETTPTNPALTGLRVIDAMHAGLISCRPSDPIRTVGAPMATYRVHLCS